MSKKEATNTIVFQRVSPASEEHTHLDEVVMRIRDISVMYIRNGSCYLQADNWDTPYQLTVSDYKQIREVFLKEAV